MIGGSDLQMQPTTREGRLWKTACEAAESRAEAAEADARSMLSQMQQAGRRAEHEGARADAAHKASMMAVEKHAEAAAGRDAWRERESKTQEALQKLGELYGVHGGEPRVAGIGRVLAENATKIASLEFELKAKTTECEIADAEIERLNRDQIEVIRIANGWEDYGNRMRDRAFRAEAVLEKLRSYAASVWFDEATASDEERELMREARALETLQNKDPSR